MANARQRALNKTIQSNLSRLRKPGVLTVRPGYEIAGHQLTGRQAIVATVHTKRSKADLSPADILPDKIRNTPVDVREATAHQRLRAHDPAAAALTQAYGRPEDKEPDWPFEREMPSGKFLNSKSSETQKTLKRQRAQQPATERALTKHEKKPPQKYDPKKLPPLTQISLTTNVTVAASPDAGFATLTKFLDGTKQSLVVGMYDFTSGPLLKEFLTDLSAPRTLKMVLDNPAPNPTRDQNDWVTVQDLQQGLGGRARIARALVRSDAFAAKWIFPSAYHIKVIVRDGNSMWLSSGNLNNSNEPDPGHPPHTEDRDWHIIFENPKLAQTFSAYLDYDYQTAAAAQTQNPDDVERAIEDAHAKRAAYANPPQTTPAPPVKSPVAAKTFTNIAVNVTPLLTPDLLPNSKQGQYLTNIMKLIANAKQSIHIQLQYIESSSGQADPYNKLLSALKQRAGEGIDVKLIVSADYVEKWGEKMKAIGVDLTPLIRKQPNVHNKGFVVDGKIVVVSSQNFSPAGIEMNRDAGLIIENPQIVSYFANLFDADWTNKSTPFVAKAAKTGSRAKSGGRRASPRSRRTSRTRKQA
jgi:phosphatidylserine/phosphatidylglycerophosphate/cardiolipin synthase-like enzyme